MHARKRARLRARAHAYVRVRASANPSRPETISPEKRLFCPADPAFWGFLPRYAAPQLPFFAPVAALSAEIFPGKGRPGVVFAWHARLFRPIFARSPQRTAPDRALCVAFRPLGSAFCHGNAPVAPVFAPATRHTTWHTARLPTPVTPALPAPAQRSPANAPVTPASAPPRHRPQHFALRKGCAPPGGPRSLAAPAGDRRPGSRKFSRNMGPGGLDCPMNAKTPPRRPARRYP